MTTSSILWEKGIYTFSRVAGVIERSGQGTTFLSNSKGGSHLSSIQVRDEAGKLTEIKDVVASDYLAGYLEAGEKATWYFRNVQHRKGRTMHYLVAVKTPDIALSDEALLKKSEYATSSIYNLIALVVSLPVSLFSLMLLSPISLWYASRLLRNLVMHGLSIIPSRRTSWEKVKSLVAAEGIPVS